MAARHFGIDASILLRLPPQHFSPTTPFHAPKIRQMQKLFIDILGKLQ